MDKQVVLLVLVIVLVGLIGVQSYQISDLKDGLSDDSLSGHAVSKSSSSQPSPQRQQSAPTMVGGC